MAFELRQSGLHRRLRRWFEMMATTQQSIFPYIRKYTISHESEDVDTLTIEIPMTPEMLDLMLGLSKETVGLTDGLD